MRRLLEQYVATGEASVAASLGLEDLVDVPHAFVRYVDDYTVVSVCYRSVVVRWRKGEGAWYPEKWVDSRENAVTWIEVVPGDASSLVLGTHPTGYCAMDVAGLSVRRMAKLYLAGRYPAAPGCEEIRIGQKGVMAAIGRHNGGVGVSKDQGSFTALSLADAEVASIAWLDEDIVIVSMSNNGELFDVTIGRYAAPGWTATKWTQRLHQVGRLSALAVSPTQRRLAIVAAYKSNVTWSAGIHSFDGELLVLDAASGEFERRDSVEFRADSPFDWFEWHRQIATFSGEIVVLSHTPGLRFTPSCGTAYSVAIPMPYSLDGTMGRVVVGSERGIAELPQVGDA